MDEWIETKHYRGWESGGRGRKEEEEAARTRKQGRGKWGGANEGASDRTNELTNEKEGMRCTTTYVLAVAVDGDLLAVICLVCGILLPASALHDSARGFHLSGWEKGSWNITSGNCHLPTCTPPAPRK